MYSSFVVVYLYRCFLERERLLDRDLEYDRDLERDADLEREREGEFGGLDITAVAVSVAVLLRPVRQEREVQIRK